MAVVAGTPLWWLLKLEKEVRSGYGDMRKHDNYYSGNHPLPFLTPAHADKIQDEFRRLLEESKSNFCRLVVDAVEERLSVEGIRLADTAKTTDPETWKIWQKNGMDMQSGSAFIESLIKGRAYLSVWAGEDNDGLASIAVEDPMQVAVAYTPGSNFMKRDAAVKIWHDDVAGIARANLYLPDGIYKYWAKEERITTYSEPTQWPHEVAKPNPSGQQDEEKRWQPLADGLDYVKNPYNVVPIVPMRNRPRLLCEGESELCDVVYVQNQINGFLFLLALAGYFGAHRQRWATGIKLQKDESGSYTEPFDVAIDRLMTMENPEGKFGEFDQTTLDGYIKAIEQKVLHIAVTTRTPRHYLIEEGQSPSGDAIKSAESGLVRKVERKQKPFGEGLEEALRLARLFSSMDPTDSSSEIVWGSAEVRSEAEVTDAAIKKVNAKLIDRQQALEDMGYSPQQILRITEVLGDTPAGTPVPPTIPPGGASDNNNGGEPPPGDGGTPPGSQEGY